MPSELLRAPRPFRILFLGGAKRLSLAEHFIRIGAAKGLAVEILSYELDTLVPIAQVAQVVRGKRWSDSTLDDDLDLLIARCDIHCVLPFVDPAIAVCARLASRHPSLLVPVSRPDRVDLFYDKIDADRWFREHGVPVPPSEGAYPRIAKPRRGSASAGIQILQDEAEERAFFGRHEREQYQVQGYIRAREYTVDAYVGCDGSVLSLVPRQRLEVRSGESMTSRTCRHSEIDRLTRLVLSQPGFRGPLTLQFLEEHGTSAVFLMEINPRYGGGVMCSIAAGADTASLMLDEALGEKPASLLNWEENFTMTRTFREVYFHADHR